MQRIYVTAGRTYFVPEGGKINMNPKHFHTIYSLFTTSSTELVEFATHLNIYFIQINLQFMG